MTVLEIVVYAVMALAWGAICYFFGHLNGRKEQLVEALAEIKQLKGALK